MIVPNLPIRVRTSTKYVSNMRKRHASSIAMKWKEDMMQPHGGGRMEGKALP